LTTTLSVDGREREASVGHNSYFCAEKKSLQLKQKKNCHKSSKVAKNFPSPAYSLPF